MEQLRAFFSGILDNTLQRLSIKDQIRIQSKIKA
jgi:hypothetical protein